MDPQVLTSLSALIRSQRTAALGTLRAGAPYVSSILYAEAADLSAFYLHLSRLAVHAQDLAADPRAGLMISQVDMGARNPLTLGRVSMQGEAALLPKDSPAYEPAKARYLARFPFAEFNFGLGDFDLYQFVPRAARYVADFGKIYDLTEADFKVAGSAP